MRHRPGEGEGVGHSGERGRGGGAHWRKEGWCRVVGGWVGVGGGWRSGRVARAWVHSPSTAYFVIDPCLASCENWLLKDRAVATELLLASRGIATEVMRLSVQCI